MTAGLLSIRWARRCALHGLAATLVMLSQPAFTQIAPLSVLPASNAALAELGRHLFFDSRLSGDLSRSCASCHMPTKGWADGQALSRAYPGSEYFRNAPTLINVGHRRRLMWDGRLDGSDLGTAVRDMVTEAHFMNADARLVQERIKQLAQLVTLWEQAEGIGTDPYGPRLFEAVAEFIRTLESRNVPIDRYLRGEMKAISPAAVAGLALFSGKAGCLRCHQGTMLSDAALHRTGVPENPEVWSNPLRAITALRHLATMGMPNYMNVRSDVGAYAVSKVEADRGRFLTPSLREIGRTAPYMHNGVFATLAEVVDFYDHGGGPGSELRPLHLSRAERAQLLAFLETLSGDPVRVVVPATAQFRLMPVAPPMAVIATAAATPPRSFPPLAPLPPPPVPSDNPMSAEKIELGRLLFFDPRLSGDGSTPCFSCHFPRRGWGEGGTRSRGYPGTWHWRNAPTVMNSAYFGTLNWDGAAMSLEHQASGAAEGAVAGNGDPAMMEIRLRFIPEYVERFRRVFGVVWPRMALAYQAIAAFERTLVSDPRRVPLDRYANGDEQALTPAAKRGLALFNGRAGCLRCHNGALASDQGFYATGVPEPVGGVTPLLQITQRWQNYQRGASQASYLATNADLGLFYTTRNPADIGKFRTPSLRELKTTAPYMHNGAFASLREVVDFYDRGGGSVANKPTWLAPLGMGRAEKEDLVSLLEALSMDQPLLVEEPILPDYAVPPLHTHR